MFKATKQTVMSLTKWFVEPLDPEPFYSWQTVIKELKELKTEGETPFQLIKYDDDNNIVIGTPSDSVFVIVFKNIKFNKLENQKFIFFGANNIAYDNCQVYFKNCTFEDLNHLPVLGQFPHVYDDKVMRAKDLVRGITPFCKGPNGKFYTIDCTFKQSLSGDDFDFFHNPIENYEDSLLKAPQFIIAETVWLFMSCPSSGERVL